MSARTDALTSWNADWAGLRVAVFGLGVTGFSVADTLVELGCEVLVIAGRHDEERERILSVLGVPVVIADDVPPALTAFAPELVITSPGYPPRHPLLVWAQDARLPVWGDIELAWRVRDKHGTPSQWMLVTGTNGKTTTTQLAAHMLAAGGVRVAPAGNIGTPVLDAVRDPAAFEVLVVEISSYQLHHTSTVSPWAAVVLNVAEDHLDWHGSFDAYRAAKGRAYHLTQRACIYNLADPTTEQLVEDAEVVEGARAIGFGLDVPSPSNLGVVDGILVDRAFLDARRTSALELATLDDLRERGLGAAHLVEDVLAAAALARSYNVPPVAIRAAITTFTPDAHRNERVAEADGILWVDDSKATNAHAAAASLSAYRSVVWVLGGLLKGVDITPLITAYADRVRAAIVIGIDRAVIVDAFAKHAPNVPVFEIDVSDTDDVMSAVVERAADVARDGDTVLLAPAAASMDQFASYADRGNRFQAAVERQLRGSHGKYPRGGSPRDGAESGEAQR